MQAPYLFIRSIVDRGDLFSGKGDEVSLQAGNGNTELLVADGILDRPQEQGVVLDLIHLARVGVHLVVVPVAARVLPIHVYTNLSGQHKAIKGLPSEHTLLSIWYAPIQS
ncbi:putative chitinase 18-11 [Rosellinia necatrix]|uniref:Putative chitinase 18-11 n=1 Tax=Rosellinia necatrix TaxID=77044 RepID=A0A1S8AB78_ROSNE|nr:putative chitinase 18-11 [Rosellinia necatrix]